MLLFNANISRGESGVGNWTVIVRDTEKNEFSGKFVDFHLKLWGEAIDADKATLLPMPDEHDDDDHDVIQSTTTAVAVSTTTIAKPETTESKALTVPTDHPERPTKAPKPSTTASQAATGTSVAEEATTTASSSWVSWLPSFGASKKAQIWIYGAVGLIVAFCCGLGIYFWVARRRRLRNDPRNNYEFELIDEEEAEGLNSGEKGVASKKNRRTRGGELYDAFAGGSDEEDEYDDYRDRSAERLAGHDPEQYVVGDESDDDLDEKTETKPLGGGR